MPATQSSWFRVERAPLPTTMIAFTNDECQREAGVHLLIPNSVTLVKVRLVGHSVLAVQPHDGMRDLAVRAWLSVQ
jgi:hypothetical protein